MRAGGAIGALLLMPGLAAAQPVQPRPASPQPAPQPGAQNGVRVQPARDVVVTYKVDGQAANIVPGGIPGPLKLSWDAAGQRIRAETEGRSQVALIDLRTHTGQAIDTTLRIVLPLPIRPQDLQPLTLEGARLTPRGKDVIAGLPCTVYQVDTGRGPGSACLTPDGVPLRGQGEIQGKPASFVALNVSYGNLPPQLFTVPQGYIALSGAGGGSSQAGGLAGRLGGLGDLRSLGQSLLGRGGK